MQLDYFVCQEKKYNYFKQFDTEVLGKILEIARIEKEKLSRIRSLIDTYLRIALFYFKDNKMGAAIEMELDREKDARKLAIVEIDSDSPEPPSDLKISLSRLQTGY
jgi:hypothetical protein